MSILDTRELETPTTDLAVTRVGLTRVDASEVELSRLARKSRINAGLADEISRIVQDIVDRVVPPRAATPLELSAGGSTLKLAASDLQFARAEFDPDETGFEVRRGRAGARVVRTGSEPVTRNGWPLNRGEPALLLDGDVIEARGVRYGVRVDSLHPGALVSIGRPRRVRAAEPSPFVYGFRLEPHGELLTVVLDAPTARAVLDTVLDGDGERPFDPTVLTDVELAIVEWVLHRVAAHASRSLLGGAAALCPCDPGETTPALWLKQTVRLRTYVGSVSIGLSGACLAALLGLLPTGGAPRFAGALRGLPVPVALVLDLGRVAALDLGLVEPGCELVVREGGAWWDAGPRGAARLLFGRDPDAAVAATVRQCGRTLLVRPAAESPSDGGRTMNQNANAPDQTQRRSIGLERVIEAVGVDVIAEIARRRMGIGELLNLAEGDVLEFAAPPGATVRLLADGVPFAVGELVDVDGALGVRVTALKEAR
jgi:flagellar motor switch/type III secretory pathway protein FliN